MERRTAQRLQARDDELLASTDVPGDGQAQTSRVRRGIVQPSTLSPPLPASWAY